MLFLKNLSDLSNYFVFRYVQLNVLFSDTYRRYTEDLPVFLRNRPRDFVSHVCKRWASAALFKPEHIIETYSGRTFNVKSDDTGNVYCVHFGDVNSMPYCTCEDWIRYHWPCKHMCAVFQNTQHQWDDICSSYRDSPYFILDSDVVTLLPFQAADQNTNENATRLLQLLTDVAANAEDSLAEVDSFQSDAQVCRQILKKLTDVTYLCNSSSHFQALRASLESAQLAFEEGIPHENGLALNNETLPVSSNTRQLHRTVKTKRVLKTDNMRHLIRRKRKRSTFIKNRRRTSHSAAADIVATAAMERTATNSAVKNSAKSATSYSTAAAVTLATAVMERTATNSAVKNSAKSATSYSATAAVTLATAAMASTATNSAVKNSGKSATDAVLMSNKRKLPKRCASQSPLVPGANISAMDCVPTGARKCSRKASDKRKVTFKPTASIRDFFRSEPPAENIDSLLMHVALTDNLDDSSLKYLIGAQVSFVYHLSPTSLSKFLQDDGNKAAWSCSKLKLKKEDFTTLLPNRNINDNVCMIYI